MSKLNISSYKNDIVLCLIVLIIAIIAIVIVESNNHYDKLIASVWYQGTLIDEIDLSTISDENKIFNKTYTFSNSIDENVKDTIKIEYKKNAIRIISSTCPKKICENTGWTSSSTKPIICMEYGFKIILNSDEYDVVIG